MKNDPILGSLRGVLDPRTNGKVGDFDPPKGVKKGQKWVQNDPFSSKNVKNHVSFDNSWLNGPKKGPKTTFLPDFVKFPGTPPGKWKKRQNWWAIWRGFFQNFRKVLENRVLKPPRRGFGPILNEFCSFLYENEPKPSKNRSAFCQKTIKIQAWWHQDRGLEGSGAGLEASSAVLSHPGRFWRRLEPSWRRLGGLLGRLGARKVANMAPSWLPKRSQNR